MGAIKVANSLNKTLQLTGIGIAVQAFYINLTLDSMLGGEQLELTPAGPPVINPSSVWDVNGVPMYYDAAANKNVPFPTNNNIVPAFANANNPGISAAERQAFNQKSSHQPNQNQLYSGNGGSTRKFDPGPSSKGVPNYNLSPMPMYSYQAGPHNTGYRIPVPNQANQYVNSQLGGNNIENNVRQFGNMPLAKSSRVEQKLNNGYQSNEPSTSDHVIVIPMSQAPALLYQTPHRSQPMNQQFQNPSSMTVSDLYSPSNYLPNHSSSSPYQPPRPSSSYVVPTPKKLYVDNDNKNK